MGENDIVKESPSRDLLAAISHELKSPITITDTIAQAVLTGLYGPVNEDIKRQLNRIHLISSRLLGTVDSVMCLEKNRAGHYAKKSEPVNIMAIATEVYDELELMVNERNQSVLFEGKSTLTEADPRLIFHILYNLLNNAIKYSPDGAEIRIVCKNKKGMGCVRIYDEAPPLSSNDKKDIFKKFSSLSIKKGLPGSTGLGLFIALQMAEAVGGWLSHHNGKRGNIFTLQVPNAKQLTIFQAG